MTTAPTLVRAALACKLAFLGLLFVNLFVAAYYPDLLQAPALQLTVGLTAGLLAVAWAHVDARLRGRQLPMALAVGIVMLAALFIPVWLFLSRPPFEATRAIIRYVAWVLALVLFFSIGAAALEGVGIAPMVVVG